MSKIKKSNPATLLAKAGHFLDPDTGGIVPPLHASTTYSRDEDYQLRSDRLYGRDDNPLFEHAEAILSELEGGADAALFSSGLAAMSAVAATLKAGEGVVLAKDCYFGVRHWLTREAARVGFDLRLFDATAPDSLADAIGKGATRLVWIESPANPTWEVSDIAMVAEAAHAADAALVVDATVTTPLICRPIEWGADIVMHSATKYLNGHADVVAGALVTAKADDAWQAIKDVRYHSGAILGPFEAWLLIRGMRTMNLRVRHASASAMAIARHFEGRPGIRAVLYPGLESHPGHAIANRQWDTDAGYTGMLSLLLDGDYERAKRFALATKLFIPATSLGGVESLIEHRKPVEGPDSDVPDELVRLSVGIEDVDELIADLEQALAGV